MNDSTLVLRDIHQLPAPSWWPPAPGWWMLAGLLAVLVFAAAWWRTRKRSRQRWIARLFDETVSSQYEPSQQVAAMSELLRRAARRRDSAAGGLTGDDWLVFLDAGDAATPFSTGAGRLLLDGGFRPDTDPVQVVALRELARERFIGWMTG